jgi:hypothetical protein
VFECGIQAANHFRGRFEERLRYGLIYFLNVAARMIDQLPEFFPNVRGMPADLLMQSFLYNSFACGQGEQTHQSRGIETTRASS